MKKGFTVIEVSLVLAIAGLIFAMAFIALPALQRSSRDTTRKDDMTGFIASVKKYQNNNRGALPVLSAGEGENIVYNGASGVSDATWQGFYDKYLGENFIDPIGNTYSINVEECKASPSTPGKNCTIKDKFKDENIEFGKLLVLTTATCDGSTPVLSSNPRNLAVLYKLEGGGVVGCAST